MRCLSRPSFVGQRGISPMNNFIKELQSLCKKYGISLIAGNVFGEEGSRIGVCTKEDSKEFVYIDEDGAFPEWEEVLAREAKRLRFLAKIKNS